MSWGHQMETGPKGALNCSGGRLCLLIVTISVLSAPLTMMGGSSQEETVVIRLGYFNNQPISFRTGEGSNKGIAIDIIEHIAGEEGFELGIIEGGRDEMVRKLKEGEVDMIAGLEVPSQEAEGLILGNESILSNWGMIFSSEDVKIGSLMDLNGKWIGVVKDDLYYHGDSGLEHLITSFDIDAEMVEFDNYNEVLDAIETGNVDAGCLNNLFATSVEGTRAIKRTGVIYNPVELRFAFDPNGGMSGELKDLIDARLEEMKNNGDSVYYSSLDRYMDKEEDTDGPLPDWLIRMMLILLAVVVFLTITTLVLRGRIRMRTRELREANQRLEQDIKERIRTEQKLEVEKSRSLFYLDLLIHDIGNLHHGLLSTMDLYQMVKDDREKADITQMKAKDLLDRSIKLIGDVRKYKEAKERPLKPEPVELVATVKKAVDSARLSFPDKNTNIEIRGAEGPMMVIAEPLLEEVFFNLVHNSIRYSEQRSTYIEIDISRSRDGKRAQVTVSDHGRGIPDEMKKNLFSRPAEARDQKHSGMGLSLVKALLDRYRGEISVKDRVSGDHTKGTTFTVRLPLKDFHSRSDG